MFYSVKAQNNEQIHIHLAKASYVAGERVWFTAYLYYKLAPDDVSTNLFLYLADTSGKIVTPLRLPVFDGVANGSLDLPFNLAQGIYLLCAFTHSQHANKHPDYIKPLFIFNPGSKIDLPSIKQKDFFSIRMRSQILAGVTNQIAFFSSTINNIPVPVNGKLLNSKGQVVTSFQSNFSGIGNFYFIPAEHEFYNIEFKFQDSSKKNYPLIVQPEGVIILINDRKDTKVVTISTSKNLHNKNLFLTGTMNGAGIFKHSFTVNEEFYEVKVPVKELPAGVAYFSVKNEEGKELNTAPTFINNEDSFLNLQLIEDTISALPGKTNVLTLVFPDSVYGNFSASVSGIEKTSISYPHIFSDLLIGQTNLPPSIYFNDKGLLKNDTLNMALQISDLPVSKPEDVIDSNYITIEGKLNNKKNESKGNAIFFLADGKSPGIILQPQINKDGNFVLRNLIFYDATLINYYWEGKGSPEITLTSKDALLKAGQYIPIQKNQFVIDYSMFSDTSLQNTARFIKQELQAHLLSKSTLDTVTVRTKKVSGAEELNRKYAKGLFYHSNLARIVDMVNEPPTKGGNVLDYLQSKISGLLITRLSGSEYKVTSVRGVSLSGEPKVHFFLNESEVTIDYIISTPIQNIAMVKYFPPGASLITGSAGGILAIYSKKPEDFNTRTINLFNGSFTTVGYSPVYDFDTVPLPANSSLLFWEPRIFLNRSQNKYLIRFKNPQGLKKFYLTVEGFTIDGRLLNFKKLIEIKY